MTKAASLHRFFSSFGLTAYEEHSVPSGDGAPVFPYLTYTVATDSLGTEIPLSLSLWYRGSSWTAANAKAEEISQTVGRRGAILPCDGGKIWLKRGTPFSQSMGDSSDNMIKRKYINLTAEFITAN